MVLNTRDNMSSHNLTILIVQSTYNPVDEREKCANKEHSKLRTDRRPRHGKTELKQKAK